MSNRKKVCAECRRQYPADLITSMFTGGEYIMVDAVCALKIRNAVHGLPKGTPFNGPLAHRLWQKTTEYNSKKYPTENPA